jgi:steroid 5-alpha reductase family enzyme
MLVRVSGVALRERDLRKSKPGYADYIARTNAFLPWPPRGRRGAAAD